MITDQPVIKRKAGRPPKDKPPPIPSYADLDLDLKDRDKQVDSLKHQAYRITKLIGRKVHVAIHDDNKQDLKNLMIGYGIGCDKVAQGVESAGIDLHVPAALLDKMVLALNVKPSVPLPLDTKQLT